MDSQKFMDTYVELERLHSRILETEEELTRIDIALSRAKSWIDNPNQQLDFTQINLSLDNIISNYNHEE